VTPFKKKINQVDGIYLDQSFDSITKKVSDFYTKNPFPNYKPNDNKNTILTSGDKTYLKGLKKIVGYRKKILEVGCGTGQFSNYFAIGSNNSIYALDPTLESLKIAKRFSDKNNIKNVTYVNGSIFEDIFEEEYFDLVFCSGVLHHTKDTYLGFKKSINLLKKGGLILIGLYNSYSKLPVKKILYNFLGYKFISLIDPILKNSKISNEEKMAWVQDQYNHPVENSHSIEEVLNWFDNNKIIPIAGIPEFNNINLYNIDQDLEDNKPVVANNRISIILKQIAMNFNILGGDGSLFCILGRKK
tara:strand:- start:1070 stop:1972 length:903 start_codon:yes stop_codon:yes gene_type:complete